MSKLEVGAREVPQFDHTTTAMAMAGFVWIARPSRGTRKLLSKSLLKYGGVRKQNRDGPSALSLLGEEGKASALSKEAPSKLSGSFFEHIVGHVRVDIGRQPDGSVAQHCTHDLQRFALLH